MRNLPREKRALPRRSTAARTLAAVSVTAGIVVASVFAAGPALAADYPSWQDVQAAKASEASAAAQITRIDGLVHVLHAKVAAAEADQARRGADFQAAQERADAATRKADALAAHAAAAAHASDTATTRAGRLAAQLYRSQGAGVTAKILLDGGSDAASADHLLADLSTMTKVVERSDGVYQEAEQAKNLSASLSSRAAEANAARVRLAAQAKVAMDAAIAATEASQAELAGEQAQLETLNGQLAALKDTTTHTVDAYEAGVAARAAAAQVASSGAGLAGGFVGPQGWAVPVHGVITAGFGPRVSPCSGCSSWHEGIDLGAACGTPIYAAHAGRVTYAGVYGTYGNFILIDDGDGSATAYGHIIDGGFLVSQGQQVSAGQPIARVGSTGASTGCHLHFEVRLNGVQVNGMTFMAQRGAPLG